MRKRLLLLAAGALALALAAAPAFSQAKDLLGGVKVTIIANIPNVSVFVDDHPMRGTMFGVPKGQHVFRVTAPGYADYVETVVVNDPITLNVHLRPPVRMFPLNIVSNVEGAAIFIDGAQVAVNPAPVPAGPHTVRVAAPGFQDFNASVNVAGPLTVNAQLMPAGFPLTVQSNVANAAIFVDGAQISGNVVNVAPGVHGVRVAAAGFLDFNANVNVAGPITVNAQLKPAGIALTIQVNAPGAAIFVDGAQAPSNVVYVKPGRHMVRVTAQGYQDFNAAVNVTGPMTVNAMLKSAGFPLTVNANVQGAVVSVNNVTKGQAPYTEVFPPGSYSVTVSAPGYLDFDTTVALSQPTTINAQLQYGMATVSVVIPPQYLDREGREGLSQLKLTVDGKPVNIRREASNMSLTAGRHRIVLSSGALVVQLGDFDFEPGMSYTVELYMELQAQPR
jgi:hypothetical protein